MTPAVVNPRPHRAAKINHFKEDTPVKKVILPLTLAYLFSPLAQAAEHEVAQRNKNFTVKELKIKKGDTVNFPNQDPFFHNVFSLSATKSFDLGSYPKGESKAIVFDKAGKVDVECSIHPNMQMTIIVE
jgi:plastocyanin